MREEKEEESIVLHCTQRIHGQCSRTNWIHITSMYKKEKCKRRKKASCLPNRILETRLLRNRSTRYIVTDVSLFLKKFKCKDKKFLLKFNNFWLVNRNRTNSSFTRNVLCSVLSHLLILHLYFHIAIFLHSIVNFLTSRNNFVIRLEKTQTHLRSN